MFVKVGLTPGSTEYRAFLDGEDVSNVCYEASEEEGYACIYLLNKDGCKYLKDGMPATERKIGIVKILHKDMPNA